MTDPLRYQLRIYLPEAFAECMRRDQATGALAPLLAVARTHRATLVSQLDAFEAYVAEAEREGTAKYPLYRWTKATIEDPERRLKHLMAFALRVEGQEVYTKEVADALEADLRVLADQGVVTRWSRHDTNPANNLPVPAEYRA